MFSPSPVFEAQLGCLDCISDLRPPVDETTAKILSATENLIRRDLNRRDAIDVCTALYKRYGSIQAVVDETGWKRRLVEEYVKYDRLQPELRDLVDKGEVKIKTALRAQDAASVSGEYRPENAVQLAMEMEPMSGPQQDKIRKEIESTPDASVEEVIEQAKSGAKVTQVIVTLGANVHGSLKTYAQQEDTSLDDAARSLIEDGLSTRGYLED